MKKKNIFIILCIIIFTFTAITSSVLALDIYHLKHCKVDGCTTCILINLAINFVKNSNVTFKMIQILAILIPLIQLVKKEIQRNTSPTLIDLKVIQIE